MNRWNSVRSNALLPLALHIATVQIDHAVGAALLYEQPLIDAWYVIKMAARKHLDEIILAHSVEADGAAVKLYP